MTVLDSRHLGPLNCFVQKVMKPGELAVDVQPATAGFTPFDVGNARKFKVKALSASRRQDAKAGKQHRIAVRPEGDKFALAPSEGMQIEEGDALLFHFPERQNRPFVVRGTIGDTSFSSLEMKDQVVFTHPFGLPGRYEWADANGSGIGGVIIVNNDPAAGKLGAERAMKRLGEGALVHIVGDKVKPKELTIATGQTVFFAVENTAGITITDRSLLEPRTQRR